MYTVYNIVQRQSEFSVALSTGDIEIHYINLQFYDFYYEVFWYDH